MEETAEIRERLERIGALTRGGAGRSDLLREVRGLLEEGEQATAPRGSGGTAKFPQAASRGKEATVS